jgi:hypothetical protein
MSSTNTSSKTNTEKLELQDKFYKGLGVIFGSLGIIIFVVILILQVLTINNGASGQDKIDTEMNKTLWSFITAGILVFVGIAIYYYYNTSERPLLLLFVLCFVSYLLSNIAILSSLYQVTVK